MNYTIDKITDGLAETFKQCITVAHKNSSAKKEIMRGGGSSGGIMTRLLMPRPISKLRISQDALDLCLQHNVVAFDYFILKGSKLKKKYKKFFSSNYKDIAKCHNAGHYLTGDHNIPNTAMLHKMFELYDNDPNTDTSAYADILNAQSYDLITLEENKKLDNAGFKATGTKEERDALCSPKIEFVDLWLTPQEVIDKFFEITQLNKAECLDPCASDGRWLGNQGQSIDILPMTKNVKQQDFLTMTKKDLNPKTKTIVGSLPSSLLSDFVNKALSLTNDCYFLVTGDEVFKLFPNNIEHVYFFSGLEGDPKDNRSKCEFDVPFLIKSAIWSCIVHITKRPQPAWEIESNITNMDDYHIAIDENTFIKSDVLIDDNPRITRIPVKSSIKIKRKKKV